MTNTEIQKRIIETAETVKSNPGFRIEINRNVPYIAIGEYFFQGEEAEKLLKEVIIGSKKFNVFEQEFLIWQSQSW